MSIIKKLKKIATGFLNNDEDIEKSEKNNIIKLNYNYTEQMYFEVINLSPNIYLAHRGARICVGLGPIEGSLREQAKHVKKVLARQHESIMEHTNIIGLFYIPYSEIMTRPQEYTEFLSSFKYLNYIPKSFNKEVMILFGGSIRGYIHALRECNRNNFFVYTLLKPFMISTIEKEFLLNVIKDGLLNENDCNFFPTGVDENEIDDSEDKSLDEVFEPDEKPGERVDFVWASPMDYFYNENSSLRKFFSVSDIYKVCAMTFIIHDVSRACSAQLTRHRCGISHESQRYVSRDYISDDFVDPIILNLEERYANEIYADVLYKMEDEAVFYNYQYLLEKNVNKEDARYWLPMGTKTKLMMTFTFENLGKFLKLRLDNHAQKEIRLVAEEMTKHLELSKEDLKEFMRITTDYNCNRTDKNDPFSPIENEEEVDEEITEEEKIKSFKIESEEEAKKLLEKSDRYNNMKE